MHSPKRVQHLALWVMFACALPFPGRAQEVSFPADGAIDVPTSVTITWPARPDASAYYLYLGTSPGLRDVVNSGEIPAPAFRVTDLPIGTMLYATLWAKVPSGWSSQAITFTTAAVSSGTGIAELVSPTPDDVIPQSLEFVWTDIPDADAYYLYVGSAPGRIDYVNSGEISATSYRAQDMPLDSIAYVRLWTKNAGMWRYRDYQFEIVGNATRLTRPVQSQNVDPGTIFEWQRLVGADHYYLYVGTAPGLNDVINSGETDEVSWKSAPLEGGSTYYVRMYTFMAGAWHFRDYTFRTDTVSVLTMPVDGAEAAEPDSSFAWNRVTGAQTYYLYVGSTPGANDIVNSGETSALSLKSQPLPGGVQLHARMWVKVNNIWHYRDSTFVTRSTPRFINPRPGVTNIGDSTTFSWTPVAGASSYQLTVGTSPRASDLHAGAPTTETSVAVAGLPLTRALYATVTATVNGLPAIGQTVFSTTPTTSAAVVQRPAAGQSLAAGSSIQWRTAPLARAYQLEIGTAPGLSNLVDTGEILVTERFVEDVPVGVLLYGRLTTYFTAGPPYVHEFSFSKAANDFPLDAQYDHARRMVGELRSLTSENIPSPNTVLASTVRTAGKDFANCVDYSQALIRRFRESGLQIEARLGAACLIPNTYDCHTFVEVRDPVRDEWFILDPTFGMQPLLADDGSYASAEQISGATIAESWSDVEYAPLFAGSISLLESYYIDYPLLYANLYDTAIVNLADSERSVIGYFDVVGSTLNASSIEYVALQCPPGETSVAAIVGGTELAFDCSGVDNLTRMFGARTVFPIGERADEVTVYRARRPVFASN